VTKVLNGEPDVPVREQLAEVGKELGRDLFTKAVVAVVLIGCILVGGLIGAQVNNDIAPLVGGATGLVVGITAALLIGLRLTRRR
jgi:hypothetical protein